MGGVELVDLLPIRGLSHYTDLCCNAPADALLLCILTANDIWFLTSRISDVCNKNLIGNANFLFGESFPGLHTDTNGKSYSKKRQTLAKV